MNCICDIHKDHDQCLPRTVCKGGPGYHVCQLACLCAPWDDGWTPIGTLPDVHAEATATPTEPAS